MIVVFEKDDLQSKIALIKAEGKSIGFVPTMGALHAGHISLVEKAKEQTEVVVASIFVNPIQFNDTSDYDAYPITIDSDIKMLDEIRCDIVFIPSKEEMYPDTPSELYDFGVMESVMEGACRPGHFNGVAVVVKRLFDLVQPDKAFFGQKDFQQLVIIKALVNQVSFPIEIISCPTIRENDGLAMSSRNVRLTPELRIESVRISQSLKKIVSGEFGSKIVEMKEKARDFIVADGNLRVEYVEIVDAKTLLPLSSEDSLNGAVVCVAVFAGSVRLIDNIIFAD